MMLRSSSTPVLGSLLSSFADSPSNETTHIVKHLPPLPATSVPHHHNNNKLSLYQTQTGSLTLSCNSSPISPSISDKGFRRAQSEGNLEGLAYAHAHAASSCNKSSVLTLETIPSFSFANHNKSLREEDDEEEDEESDEFQEEGRVKSMLVTEKMRVEKGTCSVDYYGEQEEMKYVSMMGLGFEACGDGMGGNGGDYNNSMGSGSSGGDDGERSQEVEEYYKKMVEENPRNPLVLRNYAQFLHQCKRDHDGAEKYYSRAILADPKDGEVLSQYGKLVWEMYHDQDRAISYFERAVQASPQDSHVHAAYASFLWDTEEEEDDSQCLTPHLHHGAMVVSASA